MAIATPATVETLAKASDRVYTGHPAAGQTACQILFFLESILVNFRR